MTFGEAVLAARRRLIDAGLAPDEAARDAELLARHAQGVDRATFLAQIRESVDDRWRTAYERAITRRVAREPVAYIRGTREFWGREFRVSPAVLIPRPETELVIEEALAWLAGRSNHRSLTVADIGTGSGCLAVTLAAECQQLRVLATDVSEAALAVASSNAARHCVADRLQFLLGSYWDPLPDVVDLVVANPPYVAAQAIDELPIDVRNYEPSAALFGGRDGLRDIRALVAAAGTRLAQAGTLIMEIGAGQEEDVRRVVRETPGLSTLGVRRDLQGILRTISIRRDVRPSPHPLERTG